MDGQASWLTSTTRIVASISCKRLPVCTQGNASCHRQKTAGRCASWRQQHQAPAADVPIAGAPLTVISLMAFHAAFTPSISSHSVSRGSLRCSSRCSEALPSAWRKRMASRDPAMACDTSAERDVETNNSNAALRSPTRCSAGTCKATRGCLYLAQDAHRTCSMHLSALAVCMPRAVAISIPPVHTCYLAGCRPPLPAACHWLQPATGCRCLLAMDCLFHH